MFSHTNTTTTYVASRGPSARLTPASPKPRPFRCAERDFFLPYQRRQLRAYRRQIHFQSGWSVLPRERGNPPRTARKSRQRYAAYASQSSLSSLGSFPTSSSSSALSAQPSLSPSSSLSSLSSLSPSSSSSSPSPSSTHSALPAPSPLTSVSSYSSPSPPNSAPSTVSTTSSRRSARSVRNANSAGGFPPPSRHRRAALYRLLPGHDRPKCWLTHARHGRHARPALVPRPCHRDGRQRESGRYQEISVSVRVRAQKFAG